MAVAFRILGPLEAECDGARLSLGGTKQRALLAVLLLNANEVVSSDRLIEALWGESAPESAAKALQVHVSQLRKQLEPDRGAGSDAQLLVTRAPGYTIALGPGQLDMAEFERLAAAGRAALDAGDPDGAAVSLRDALSLWRGPPLGDLAFEPFAQAEITRLEELRVVALENRIEADLALGRAADLVGELEALVAAEPLRERPWGQLMLALYQAGRQAEALEAYRRARETLVSELGIEPGKALHDLHEAVLNQDPALDLAAPPAASLGSDVSAQPEVPAGGGGGFVGREREVAALEAALDRAIDGRGSVCLIGGEPGIGKSRLADQVADLARARGARVLWGRCWEAGGAPAYWPWVQALRAYISNAEPASLRAKLGGRGAELAQLLPELRERFSDLPEPGSPDSESARFRLFDATAEFIANAAGDEPILLVLDDLHAADTPSLLMLSFIASQIGAASALVLGTYRDVEVGPDHPLDATVEDLGRQHSGEVLTLQGLDEPAVARLVEASAESAPSRKVVSAIHRGTAGNPLFVGELVRLLVSEGRLDDAAGDASGRVGIPRGIQEVIGRRLDKVRDECRRALGVAAVLGREFDLESLAGVTGREASELLDVVDEAVAQRIVAEVAGVPGRMRFSHVLIRDVLYEELGASRRSRLHARAGEALEALHTGDPAPHFAELAHHFFEAGPAGDPAKALEYARRAGDRAASQLAFEEAARLYELGIRALRAGGPNDDATRFELTLALADSRLRAGDEEEAKATFLAAAEVARRLDDAEALGRAALGYGGLLVWPAARGDQHLIPLLDEALAKLPAAEDSPLRARLMARLACAVRDQPDRERALPLSADAVAIARRLHDPRTLAYTLDGRCILVTDPGSVEAFAETAREVIDLSESIGELERAFTGNLYLMASLLELGDIDGTKRALAALVRHGEDLRVPTYLWGSAEVEAMLALFEGRFDAAEELVLRAYETGRHAERFNAVAAYVLQRFLLQFERGGLKTCERDLEEAAAEWPTYHILRSAQASLHTELDQLDEARAVFEDIASNDFERVYFDEEFLASMTLLADVCAALEDLERAEAIYTRLLPYADRNAFGKIEIALGSVDRPLGVLALVLGRRDAAVDHLQEAIALNERMGARPWVAHARFDLGRALAEIGGPRAAERSADSLGAARSEFERLGMAPWARRAARALDQLGSPTR